MLAFWLSVVMSLRTYEDSAIQLLDQSNLLGVRLASSTECIKLCICRYLLRDKIVVVCLDTLDIISGCEVLLPATNVCHV
jgi:hypothetical protein